MACANEIAGTNMLIHNATLGEKKKKKKSLVSSHTYGQRPQESPDVGNTELQGNTLSTEDRC